jgi:hypothetical protein
MASGSETGASLPGPTAPAPNASKALCRMVRAISSNESRCFNELRRMPNPSESARIVAAAFSLSGTLTRPAFSQAVISLMPKAMNFFCFIGMVK